MTNYTTLRDALDSSVQGQTAAIEAIYKFANEYLRKGLTIKINPAEDCRGFNIDITEEWYTWEAIWIGNPTFVNTECQIIVNMINCDDLVLDVFNTKGKKLIRAVKADWDYYQDEDNFK